MTADKGETIYGAYVAEENLIYIAKEQEEPALIHGLLHELYHVFEHHTERMDREAKADSFAAMLMRIYKTNTVDELLIAKERNGKKASK